MADPMNCDVLDRLFRSARTFNTYLNRPVSEEELRSLYDLLKWGPTSTNSQPLSTTVVFASDGSDPGLKAMTYWPLFRGLKTPAPSGFANLQL
jgi:hypothetical protein